MYVDAVEDHQGGELLSEADVQTANRTRAIFVGSICDTGVRCDRQASLAPQVLTHGRIKGLAGWRPDSVRACAQYQRGPPLGFGDGQPVRQWTDFVRPGVVLDAGRKTRQEFVSQCRSNTRPRNLISDKPDARCPSIFDFVFRPANCAAFSRSERSARHGRGTFYSNSAVLVVLFFLSVLVLMPGVIFL